MTPSPRPDTDAGAGSGMVEARVERVQQAVASLAVIAATTRTRLGRLAGGYTAVLAPAMLWLDKGSGGRIPSARYLVEAEAVLEELGRSLTAVYDL
ncbi:hypothetical protein ACFWAR_19370 [Streptomyces sp. NPDC059917]|uniref:hypothetical protein n=1 Tax=Streptomyces sp. NPDC059917 TaxID=3347002 RepID=UPI00365EC8C1